MNTIKKIITQKKYYLFGLFFLMLGPTNLLAQQDSTAQESKVEVFSQVREELHRYMGYEELFSKYISLPYDVTMNTNIENAFVDISYLLLMFLPILFLLGLKSKGLKALTAFLMVLFLIFSVPNGFRAQFNLTNETIKTQLELSLIHI